jgi:catechol 2,3-dioxygenase
VDFYSRVLGLELISEGDEGAVLGAAHDRPLLELTRLAHPSAVPRHSAGLFHVALLHPTRAALASTVMRVAGAGWPVTGASDHGVSEAIYLDDPDGLGLEIYSDRPREQWPRVSDGSRVAMFTAPLDLEDLLATAPGGPTAQIEPGTVIGHVHLKVSDVERALGFYRDALGFGLEARMPSAAFVGAGGYHHHFGLNSWQSSGAPPAPPTAPGLRLVELELSDAEALDALERRAAASAPAGLHRDEDHVTMHDPDRHALVVSHRLAQRAAPSPA